MSNNDAVEVRRSLDFKCLIFSFSCGAFPTNGTRDQINSTRSRGQDGLGSINSDQDSWAVQ